MSVFRFAGEHRRDPRDIGDAQARGSRVPVQRRVPVVHRQGRHDIPGVRPGEIGRRPGNRGDIGPAQRQRVSGTRASVMMYSAITILYYIICITISSKYYTRRVISNPSLSRQALGSTN